MDINKLYKAMEKDKVPKVFADYVVWQLQNMRGREELAETTAEEIIGGKIKVGKAMAEIESLARKNAVDGCGMLSNIKITQIIRKQLCIDGVVNDKEAAMWLPEGMDIPDAELAAGADVGNAAPSAQVSIDFDSLFD